MFCFELFFCFNVPLSTKQMLLQQAQIFQGVTADPVEQAQIVPTPLRNAEGFNAGTINENQWLKQTLFLCTTLFQVKTSPYRLSKLPLNIPDPSPCPPCPRIQIPLQVSLSYLLRFLCVSFPYSNPQEDRIQGNNVLHSWQTPSLAANPGFGGLCCPGHRLLSWYVRRAPIVHLLSPWCHHPLPAFFYLTR